MTSDSDGRLSRLLRLKQCERPDGRFWEDFDARFQKRRLGTLVKNGLGRSMANVLRRAVRPALTLAGVFCVGLWLWNTPTAPFLPAVAPQEFLLLTLESDGALAPVENELDGADDISFVSPSVHHGGGSALVAYNF
jgi:hypothetical protein